MQNRMRSKMVRLGLSLAPVFLWAASTQAAPRSIYFWNSAAGTESSRAGVDLARPGAWGNGEFSDARDVKYEGANTLKITTRNFREGVRFDLKTPLDISEYKEAGYIRFRLRFNQSGRGGGGRGGRGNQPGGSFGGAGGAGGGFGGVPGGGMPGGMPGGPPEDEMPGGFAAAEMGEMAQMTGTAQMGVLPPLGNAGGLPPGLGGRIAIPSGPSPQETPITQLLCTLILDNGIMEGKIDIPKSWDNPRRVDLGKTRPDSAGWMLLSLKLKDMRSTPGASGFVRRLILSADKQDSFYLTQAALVVETGAITVSIRKVSDVPGTQTAEITVRPGATTLVADVEAGAADPTIEWNFDADNVGNLPRLNAGGAPGGGRGGFPGGPPMTPDGGMPGGFRAPREGGMPGEFGEQEIPVGPRIDARGLIAKFSYPDEEQNYRVEVTVRDRSGKKEPVTASVLVRVRG